MMVGRIGGLAEPCGEPCRGLNCARCFIARKYSHYVSSDMKRCSDALLRRTAWLLRRTAWLPRKVSL